MFRNFGVLQALPFVSVCVLLLAQSPVPIGPLIFVDLLLSLDGSILFDVLPVLARDVLTVPIDGRISIGYDVAGAIDVDRELVAHLVKEVFAALLVSGSLLEKAIVFGGLLGHSNRNNCKDEFHLF